ncbi:uncharacterized protein [Triticum aestivum]|uniref:uncharacterized protein isoform X1 n=1 Tax=Triticum aestivum TaxID=4565 RepID=UPI001D031279|nr:uncharacterized protein LOC123069460 isoform X1 [Triticum aestivum]
MSRSSLTRLSLSLSHPLLSHCWARVPEHRPLSPLLGGGGRGIGLQATVSAAVWQKATASGRERDLQQASTLLLIFKPGSSHVLLWRPNGERLPGAAEAADLLRHDNPDRSTQLWI